MMHIKPLEEMLEVYRNNYSEKNLTMVEASDIFKNR